jgi:hypothetical protein
MKKNTVVSLGQSTYHYWRTFLKSLLRENGITTAKFIKTGEGGEYNGHINIQKEDKANAMVVIKYYQFKQQCIDLVW